MKIIESWEDHAANVYAIVRNSKKEQKEYHSKKYEALWLDDMTSKSPELYSLGGSVGYTTAQFDTIEEARGYLLKGIKLKDKNPEFFLEMIKV